MRPRATILGLVLASIAFSSLRAAGPVPEVKIENVRVGFGDGQFKDGYKIGAWTPVWVDLKGGPNRFEGVLEFIAPDDSNTPTTIRRFVNVPANEMVTVSLIVRPGSRFGELNARVVGPRGGRAKDSWSGGSIESLGPESAIVLASGQVPGLTEVKDMPKYASATNNGGVASRLIVAPLRPRDGFPASGTGSTRPTPSCSIPTTRPPSPGSASRRP